MKKYIILLILFSLFTAPLFAGVVPPSISVRDSLGVDITGNDVTDAYLYSSGDGAFFIKKGDNITLSVSGAVLTIASAAGGGSGIFDDSTTYYVNPTARDFEFAIEGSDLRIKFIDSTVLIGNDTICYVDSDGTLVFGGIGLSKTDSLEVDSTGFIRFLNESGDTINIDYDLADSMVNQKGVYAIEGIIEDSLNEYSLTTTISSTYETITNVALIGDDTTNFKTAFGWGDHSAQGYVNTLAGYFAFMDRTYFDTLVDASGDSVIVIYSDSALGVQRATTDRLGNQFDTYYSPTTHGHNLSDSLATDAELATHAGISSVHHTKTTTVAEISDFPTNHLADSDFASNGILRRTGIGIYDVITDNSTNWNTAFGWGDHSTIGYENYDDSGSYQELPMTVINSALYIGNVADTATADSIAATIGKVNILIADSLDEYSLTSAISSTYETIAEVAKIGDDTTNYQTAYDSVNANNYMRNDGDTVDVGVRYDFNNGTLGNIDSLGADTIVIGLAAITTLRMSTDDITDITGLGLYNNSNTLAVDVDNVTIDIATNSIQVKDGGITSVKILDQTITNADMDTTASDFVFADAYKGTSAIADSQLVTKNYVDNIDLLNNSPIVRKNLTVTGNIIQPYRMTWMDTFDVFIPNADTSGRFFIPPEYIVNANDTFQMIHPDVIYFPDKYLGYYGWMIGTPYMEGSPSTENPSILVSQDINLETWYFPISVDGTDTLNVSIFTLDSIVNASNCSDAFWGITLGYELMACWRMDIIEHVDSNVQIKHLYGRVINDRTVITSPVIHMIDGYVNVGTNLFPEDGSLELQSPSVKLGGGAGNNKYYMWAVEDTVQTGSDIDKALAIWQSDNIETPLSWTLGPGIDTFTIGNVLSVNTDISIVDFNIPPDNGDSNYTYLKHSYITSYTEDYYEGLFVVWTNDINTAGAVIFYGVSRDGINDWIIKQDPILVGNGFDSAYTDSFTAPDEDAWDSRWIYRPAMTKIINKDWDWVWYSAKDHAGSWFIGQTKIWRGSPKEKTFMINSIDDSWDFPFWQPENTIYFVEVVAYCQGGTNVIGQLQEYNSSRASPTDVESSDWTITTTTYIDPYFPKRARKIEAGNWLGWKTTSVSGVVDFFYITVKYYEE